MRLSDFTVLSFDCYGTLIDWETGIWAGLQPLVVKAGVARSREAVLASFARHETAQETETPGMIYSELLARVYRRLAAEWGVAADAEAERAFGHSVGDWPEFADSRAALRYLKRFYRLVILSNVDRASFGLSNRRLGVEFDAVFTAEEVGAYKPDPRNFHFMLEALRQDGHEKGAILHVAQSLFHDHQPANALGLASAWIDRRQGAEGWGATPAPEKAPHYDFRFASLSELAAAHRWEMQG
jgi:2-haloacid dehalogenase